MTPDDLAQLHAACFTTPRPWSAQEFTDLASSPLVFVITDKNAMIMGRTIVDEAELLTLAVAPDARRTGMGRRLVQAFLAAAKARGATTAFLEVAADNAPAIALYHSAGFTESGRRRGYYHPPQGPAVDAIVMARGV